MRQVYGAALKWSLGHETHFVWYEILFFVIYEANIRTDSDQFQCP